MKTKLLFTALALAPSALLAQSITYTITAKINPAETSAKAYLSYRTDAGNKTDSALVQNGAFTFNGTLAEQVKGTLTIAHKGESLRSLRRPDAAGLYIENGSIAINATDSVSKASVNGGRLNKDNQELTKATQPFTDKIRAAGQAYRALPKEQRTDAAEAAYEKQTEDIENSQKGTLAQFIKSHPNSLVALDALKTYGGYFPEASDVEPLYAQLTTSVKTTAAGKQYNKWLEGWKTTALGAQAPEFAQTDKDGKAISLASFRGKYVLVDFWASWCGPCRKENPNVVKAFNQFKDKNFTILGVSLDSNRDAWLKAVADDHLDWTQVSDLKYWKNEVAELYGVRAIPQNFLIDPSGKIIAKNLRGDQLAARLTSAGTE